MAGKRKIQTLSNWTIGAAIALLCSCGIIASFGLQKYRVLQTSIQEYIDCEAAARKLQEGSDNLTTQVRLAVSTGEQQYVDAYFQEEDVAKNRECAVEELKSLHGDPDAITPLQEALDTSMALQQTEYRAMRLVEEALNIPQGSWPEEIRQVELTSYEQKLSNQAKLDRARALVIDLDYENAKSVISKDVQDAVQILSGEILQRQEKAVRSFSGVCRMFVLCMLLFAAEILLESLVMREQIFKPILRYTECVKHGPMEPVEGAYEIQTLARAYNDIYRENKEREMLMKRQAEHDPLTELLNRGSFDRILSIYLKDKIAFALVIIDVDNFKSVNDTHGHAVGDQVLKRVAGLLRAAFRSVDYVCRIGGDEFAVIMLDVTQDLGNVLIEKITQSNRALAEPIGKIPAVSLSAGAAFTDGSDEALFEHADQALYQTKENGRKGCTVYNANT